MDINERIAQLKAQIAEKEAYQKKLADEYSNPYRNHKYANTWDYVVEGNRTGYDKEDAEEAAYHNMLRQQEQQERMLALQQAQQEKMLGLQQDFTAEQNDLNRQNAMDIAEQNKVIGANDKIDELTRLRGKSLVNLQYAEAAYKQADAKGDTLAKESAMRDIQLAKEDLAYYNKRLGTNVETSNVPSDVPSDNKDKDDINEDVVLSKGDKYDMNTNMSTLESYLKELESHPRRKQNGNFQVKINNITTLISKKKALEAKKSKLLKAYKAMSSGNQRIWKKNNPNDAKLIGV